MTHVLYHANCIDGFGAAYVASLYYRAKSEPFNLVPCSYGGSVSAYPVTDPVRVFDFSWKRPVLERMLDRCPDLYLFDHHTTAEKELEGLPHCTFDMTKSGAQLAWAYYFGDEPEPWWVAYIADRDLWKKKLVGCDDVHAWLGSYPKTIEAWDQILDANPTRAPLAEALTEGRAIQRVFRQMQTERLTRANCFQTSLLGGFAEIWWTYCDEHRLVSQLCLDLAARSASRIGICVFPDGNYSIRSTEDGPDVGALAARFGGGGHKHSAGCTGDPFGLLKRS
jgi:oligoribonuclease NrnB/cAMP/cGMP phosphodiesterase (DHH superfamily)